jgi:diacylglycerol kinase (ATP)
VTRLAVAVNPTAHQGHADGAGARVLARLRERGVEVVEVSGSDFSDALARARAAVAAGVDALVVVAEGSGNDFARALALPVHEPAGAVELILRRLDAGVRVVDAVRASVPGRAQDARWFCGVLSAGLDAAVNARANALRRPRGRARYAVAVLDELRRFEPFGYRVTTDGAPWESRGTLVAVANGPSIGGGIRIAPAARIADGELVGPLPLEVRIVPGALHVPAPLDTGSSASAFPADAPT